MHSYMHGSRNFRQGERRDNLVCQGGKGVCGFWFRGDLEPPPHTSSRSTHLLYINVNIISRNSFNGKTIKSRCIDMMYYDSFRVSYFPDLIEIGLSFTIFAGNSDETRRGSRFENPCKTIYHRRSLFHGLDLYGVITTLYQVKTTLCAYNELSLNE